MYNLWLILTRLKKSSPTVTMKPFLDTQKKDAVSVFRLKKTLKESSLEARALPAGASAERMANKLPKRPSR